MGEKDLTEKALLYYNDVFADIVNVLIFNGQEIICTDDLTEADSHTYYYDEEHIREQEQDIVKNWISGEVQFACIGFENQTCTDNDMIFRVFGYEGARYRSQLNQKSDCRYPIMTLVLYYGYEHPWNHATSLHKKLNIRPEIKEQVVDFHINVYDIAYLSPDTVALFKSDFRIVADYFVQMRQNKNYIPSKIEFQHVQETLHLLAAVTDDMRFETSYINYEKEEPKNMCEVIDCYINMGMAQGKELGIAQGKELGIAQGKELGIAQGKELGIAQGKELGMVEAVKALMESMGFSLSQAMAALKVSPELQAKIKQQLS